MTLTPYTQNCSSRQKQKKTTPWTILTYPHTEPPQTLEPKYTGSSRSRRPSSPLLPTTPHTTITQQSYLYLFNRLDTYNLQHEEYQNELNIIHNILHNNYFPIKPLKPLPTTHRNKQHPAKQNKTGASFTYVGKETLYITNIFRWTELKIEFRTTNTIGNMLTHKNHAPDKLSLWGVYKLTCTDCNKTYVVQTGRQFSTRYKEHETALHNNNNNMSSFAKHLIEEAH